MCIYRYTLYVGTLALIGVYRNLETVVADEPPTQTGHSSLTAARSPCCGRRSGRDAGGKKRAIHGSSYNLGLNMVSSIWYPVYGIWYTMCDVWYMVHGI